MERIISGEKITEGLLLRGTGVGGLLRFEKLKSNYNYRSPVLLPWRIPLIHSLIPCTLPTLLKNILTVSIGANVSASDIQKIYATESFVLIF